MEQQRLTGSPLIASADDQFGSSVAISGDRVLIGAPFNDIQETPREGAAYLFVRNGTIWMPEAILSGSHRATDNFFGASVALVGETAVVGAWGSDVGLNPNQGRAFVFTRSPSPSPWGQKAILTASDGASFDAFGFSVAMSGNTVIVGNVRG